MNSIFANRMSNMKASEIRELLKITEQPEIISFAGGLPAPELFPLNELSNLAAECILNHGTKALQYSTTEGYTPLRQKIAQRMLNVNGAKTDVNGILITSGSQQALDLIGKVFIDRGDEVFMESPSYLGAINAFRAYEPNFIEVDTDGDGMIPDKLEESLKKAKHPKLIYIVPDFQNPTGRTWSFERRKILVDLAKRYGVVVIEDNPYGELRFEGEKIPSVKSLDSNGNVVYLGTFSKILCPGMRIGWIAAAGEIMERFVMVKQAADLHTSTISQMQINLYLEKFCIDAHVEIIRKAYKERRDALIEAMKYFFNENISFTIPKGGMFSWVELARGADSRRLLEKAIEKKVAFVPGGSFYPCVPRHNTLRINFSNMPKQRIIEGVERLGEIFSE